MTAATSGQSLPHEAQEVLSQATLTRLALFGGCFSAFGPIIGWFSWILANAFSKNAWETILAPCIGAAVGWLVHVVHEYVNESLGRASAAEGTASTSGHGTKEITIGAGSLLFAGLACEHLVAELIHNLLVPFLVAAVTLFPVGAMFAMLLYRHDAEFNKAASIGVRQIAGGIVGGFCALPSAAIAAFITATPNLRQLIGGIIGWWVLVGVGFYVVKVREGTNALLPVCGVLIAGVLLIGGGFVRPIAGYVWGAAAVPSSFWVPAPSTKDRVGEFIVERVNSWCKSRTGDVSNRVRSTCHSFQQGEGWSMVRSWMVMLLFGFGLGIGHAVERKLRPDLYFNTHIRKMDNRGLTVIGVLVVVMSMLIVRLPGGRLFLSPNSQHVPAPISTSH